MMALACSLAHWRRPSSPSAASSTWKKGVAMRCSDSVASSSLVKKMAAERVPFFV